MRMPVGWMGMGVARLQGFYQKTEDNRKFWIHMDNWKVNVKVSLGERCLKDYVRIDLLNQMASTLTVSLTHSVPCLPIYLVCRCWRNSWASQRMVLFHFLLLITVWTERIGKKSYAIKMFRYTKNSSRQKKVYNGLISWPVTWFVILSLRFLRCSYYPSLDSHHLKNLSVCDLDNEAWSGLIYQGNLPY
jgi:hypothetical protein